MSKHDLRTPPTAYAPCSQYPTLRFETVPVESALAFAVTVECKLLWVASTPKTYCKNQEESTNWCQLMRVGPLSQQEVTWTTGPVQTSRVFCFLSRIWYHGNTLPLRHHGHRAALGIAVVPFLDQTRCVVRIRGRSLWEECGVLFCCTSS